jgi:hypothetical protein
MVCGARRVGDVTDANRRELRRKGSGVGMGIVEHRRHRTSALGASVAIAIARRRLQRARRRRFVSLGWHPMTPLQDRSPRPARGPHRLRALARQKRM